MTDYPDYLCDQVKRLPEHVQACSGIPLVLLFGCGPSLDEMSDAFWCEAKNHYCGGVNGSPIIMSKHGLSLDLWLSIDGIRELDKPCNYPGIANIWNNVKPADKPLRLMSFANRSEVITDMFVDHCTSYDNESIGVCKYGRSSLQALVHWVAQIIKPETIALFGVDYKGPGRAGGLNGNASHKHGKKLEKTFTQMRQYIEGKNIKLVNCSPGTGLKAIPAINWKELI